MSNRTDLSAHTRMELSIDGVPYLVTTIKSIASQWPRDRMWIGTAFNGWSTLPRRHVLRDGANYRVSLFVVAPVYEYREGEACLCVVWSDYYQAYIVTCPATPDDEDSDDSTIICFARRAAIVCDTADQFGALHAALKEARG